MEKERPLLVVVSIVRNEAWVLDAFLSAASLWADMIVIADQMSTDGSREIYKRYPKVHVIDNDRPNMHQAASRRLVLDETRRLLNGNTNAVLFALDADEFLEGEFTKREEWKKILNSKPNDCFEWRWMNLLPGDAKHYTPTIPEYWAVHVSDQLWDGEFPDNSIHEWRLPFPAPYDNEIVLENIHFIHFGRYNIKRQENKERFYQISSLEDKKRFNVINIYRQYHYLKRWKGREIPTDAYKYYQDNGFDIPSMIDMSDEGAYYTQEIKKYFAKHGFAQYAMLEIWDEDWCKRNDIVAPKRNVIQKMVMWYLRKSRPYSRKFLVHAIDYILKKLY